MVRRLTLLVLFALPLGLIPRAFGLADTNGDGMSDLWTALYAGVAGHPDEDPDHDGQTNLMEARAGTNPLSAASRFITTTTKDANGQVLVVWADVPGKGYTVQESHELVLDSWFTPEAAAPTLANGTWTYETSFPPQQMMMLRAMGGGGGGVPVLEATVEAPGLLRRILTPERRPLQRYDLQIEIFDNGLAALQWFEQEVVETTTPSARRGGRPVVESQVVERTYRLLTDLDLSFLPNEGVWRDQPSGYELGFRTTYQPWFLFDLHFEISSRYNLNRYFGGAGLLGLSRRNAPPRFYDAPFTDLPHGGYSPLGSPQEEFLSWLREFSERHHDAIAEMQPPSPLMMGLSARALAPTGDITTDAIFWRVVVQDKDTDGDGLTDWEELQLGIDPANPDTDGDGMNDGWEYQYGQSPSNPLPGSPANAADADPDADGLTNALESAAGTNPNAGDTDNDGALDGVDGMALDAHFKFPRIDVPQYAVIDLGEGRVVDMNDQGQVLIEQTAGGNTTYFLWTAGDRKPLPTVDQDNCPISWQAIADNGAVLGYSWDGGSVFPARLEAPYTTATFKTWDDLWAQRPPGATEVIGAVPMQTIRDGRQYFLVTYGRYVERADPWAAERSGPNPPPNLPDPLPPDYFNDSILLEWSANGTFAQHGPVYYSAHPSDPGAQTMYLAYAEVPNGSGGNDTLKSKHVMHYQSTTFNEGNEAYPHWRTLWQPAPSSQSQLLINDRPVPFTTGGWGALHQDIEDAFAHVEPHAVVSRGDVYYDTGAEIVRANWKTKGAAPYPPDQEIPVVLSRLNKLGAGIISTLGEHLWLNGQSVALSTLATLPADWSNLSPTQISSKSLLAAGSASVTANGTTTTHAALLLPACLQADLNRDGKITAGPEDRPAGGKPFRFWINDDNDSTETTGDDTPGSYYAMADYGTSGMVPDVGTVDQTRDLIDFFPVLVDLSKVGELLDNPNVKVRLSGAPVNVVETQEYVTAPLNGLTVGQYLTNPATAQLLATATTHRTNALYSLSAAFVAQARLGRGILLVEGRSVSDLPLTLELVFQTTGGDKVGQVKMPLRLEAVQDMFRRVNLANAINGGVATDYPSQTDQPPGYPDSECNAKWFVFVHGYNVDQWAARGWQAEMFKRLYWAGSKAKFVGVTWHGATGINYHMAVINAFLTGEKLGAALSFCTGDVTVAGHSLGNMVVSSALAFPHAAGNVPAGYTPLAATRYFLLNAAVPLEAYQADLFGANLPAMTTLEWSSYDPRYYSSHWHQLFSGDARSALTWKGLFAGVGSIAYNFYSSSEDVMKNSPGASFSATEAAIESWQNEGEFAWVAQEKAKGLGSFNLMMPDQHAGWEHNYYYWDVPIMLGELSTYRFRNNSEMAAVSNTTLRIEPFFRKFVATTSRFSSYNGTALLAALGDTNAQNQAKISTTRYKLLGEALPATSFGAAANPILDWEDANFNMDGMRSAAWPQERFPENNWRHSDIKNVAYPYVDEVFTKMVEIGGLK